MIEHEWEAVHTTGRFISFTAYSAATREQVEAWIEKQSRSNAAESYEVRKKPNTGDKPTREAGSA